MATADRNTGGNGGENAKKTEKGEKKFPHLIAARTYNPGEIRSLIELVPEFNRNQVQVQIHETSQARYLDVRTEVECRARYIDFLLQTVKDAQHLVQHLLDQPVVDHPFEKPYKKP